MRLPSSRCLVVALLLSPGLGYADTSQIEKKLSEYEVTTEKLRSGIRAPSSIGQARTDDLISRRILDAEVNFGVGNFDDAAVVLYDVTEKHKSHPGWPEAAYYLGESLFQKGDLVGARRSFAELIEKEGKNTKYYQQSLQRLIELTLKLDDGTDADRWLSALDDVPTKERRNTVPYVRGKYAFFKKDYDKALPLFTSVPTDSDLYPQARYFLAASLVGRNELGKALEVLSNLVKLPVKSKEHKRVVELGHMAMGRIYYERDQASEAVNSYLNISRKSNLFDEALYEIAWVHVKDKNNGRAIEALELLDLADPSSEQVPDVRILEGNLRIREGQKLSEKGEGNSQEQYDKAVVLFDSLRAVYAQPRAQLRIVRKEGKDPRAYMAQITGRESKTFETRATLPPVAAGWLRKEPGVGRVVAVEKDLADIQAEVEMAEATIERLEKTLNSQSRVNSFPNLAAKRSQSTEILEQLGQIRVQLNDKRREKVNSKASASQRAELDVLLKQRLALLAELGALPNSGVAFRDRIQQEKTRYIAMDQTAAQIATTSANTLAELRALEHFLKDESTKRMPAKEIKAFKKNAEELKLEMKGLEEQLAKAQHELLLAQDVAGVSDPTAKIMQSKREELATVLSRESQILSAIGDDPKLASLERRASDITKDLESLNSQIDETVDQALSEVRTTVSEEKVNLASYRQEFLNYENESRELGGEVINASFDNVERKFADILIRSDAGTIDVTWSVRESADQLVKRLTLDQARERKTLDSDFADVIKEVRDSGKTPERLSPAGGAE